jgi:hypothetical protein
MFFQCPHASASRLCVTLYILSINPESLELESFRVQVQVYLSAYAYTNPRIKIIRRPNIAKSSSRRYHRARPRILLTRWCTHSMILRNTFNVYTLNISSQTLPEDIPRQALHAYTRKTEFETWRLRICSHWYGKFDMINR